MEWISVKDRLPWNHTDVLTYSGPCEGESGMDVAQFNEDWWICTWNGSQIVGVTHWMPLPKPPIVS